MTAFLDIYAMFRIESRTDRILFKSEIGLGKDKIKLCHKLGIRL